MISIRSRLLVVFSLVVFQMSLNASAEYRVVLEGQKSFIVQSEGEFPQLKVTEELNTISLEFIGKYYGNGTYLQTPVITHLMDRQGRHLDSKDLAFQTVQVFVYFRNGQNENFTLLHHFF